MACCDGCGVLMLAPLLPIQNTGTGHPPMTQTGETGKHAGDASAAAAIAPAGHAWRSTGLSCLGGPADYANTALLPNTQPVAAVLTASSLPPKVQAPRSNAAAAMCNPAHPARQQDSPMKFASIALTALTAVAGSSCTHASPPAHLAAAITAAAHARTVSASAAPDNVPQPAVTRAAPTHADTTPYLCQPGTVACIAGGPLLASSPAEAHWLIAHGYPSPAEHARLSKMDLAQLQAESQAGNQAATVLYGTTTALSGRFYSGVAILRKAAASGNIYAYYGLSEAYICDTPQKNLVDSAAYLRLAYLLGDRKASAAIAQRVLSDIENVVADERAAVLYQIFANSPRPSPRPFE